mgnify:CR=1 FL=1|tara:strand:- start:1957 stop:2784 length:828 start_codon:yes stop_codon:yes gene_type:complete
MNQVDIKKFNEDGFVIIKNVFDANYIDNIRRNCIKLFNQNYETGLLPDKIKWKKTDIKSKAPRSLCNIWKSNRFVADISLNKKIGKIAGYLMNWSSVRLNQDSVIWVPPKSGNVSFHQDEPYQDWHIPGKILTAWIPLLKTFKKGGTLEYVPGSHKWKTSKRLNQFLGAKDYMYHLKKNTKKKIKIYSVELNKGDVVLHHGKMWHGSTINKTSLDRISLSLHLMNGKSKFHPKIKNPLFSKFKIFNSTKMEESFFPIIWSKKNYRSKFISNYVKK